MWLSLLPHEYIALWLHYGDVIMGAIASQVISLTIVYSTVYSDAGQRKHQSSASLAFVWGIHRGPVNSPHKWPVTRKMFPFDDVIVLRRNPKEENDTHIAYSQYHDCRWLGDARSASAAIVLTVVSPVRAFLLDTGSQRWYEWGHVISKKAIPCVRFCCIFYSSS